VKKFFVFGLAALAFVLNSCGTPNQVSTPATTQPAPTSTESNTSATATRIQIITQTTVGFGLTVYGSRDAAEARLVAAQIQLIVSSSILPYLSGSQGVSTAVLNTVLKENFITLPPAAQQLIALAGGLLDSYLPVPSATTYLSEAQLAYAKAFFFGLSDGAGQFLGNKASRGIELPKGSLPTKPGAWLDFNEKK